MSLFRTEWRHSGEDSGDRRHLPAAADETLAAYGSGRPYTRGRARNASAEYGEDRRDRNH